MLALAWIFALLGTVVAYIVSLAGAMKTVPSLTWREALPGLPLPAIAAMLSLWYLVRSSDNPRAKPWLSAGIPLALALLAFLIVAVSYFDQPGGPR